jgi:hypothetical protein
MAVHKAWDFPKYAWPNIEKAPYSTQGKPRPGEAVISFVLGSKEHGDQVCTLYVNRGGTCVQPSNATSPGYNCKAKGSDLSLGDLKRFNDLESRKHRGE